MKNVSEIMFRWCLTYDAVYIKDGKKLHIFYQHESVLLRQNIVENFSPDGHVRQGFLKVHLWPRCRGVYL